MATDLVAIRERDSKWVADYTLRHESDGYGQAAADRRTLLQEIEVLREQVRELRKYSIAACSDMGCFCDDEAGEEKCSMCVLGDVIRAFEEPTGG